MSYQILTTFCYMRKYLLNVMKVSGKLPKWFYFEINRDFLRFKLKMAADDIIRNSKIRMFLAIFSLLTCVHAQISLKVSVESQFGAMLPIQKGRLGYINRL